MSTDNPAYGQVIKACDDLMKNPKLSLYEEVEIIKGKARGENASPEVLGQLSRDLSFLIERLPGEEKRRYVSRCEDGKETKLWDSTEP
jgi:hypothetical protein